MTRLIHQHIVEAVELRGDDDLVDIGCGDGTLLRMAQQIGVRSAVGLLATGEEVSLLRRTGLDVRQGFTHQLPLADGSASVVVCNSVLLIVRRENIPASLREMFRIAKPGARVFIGEIPFAEHKDPSPKFETRRELLSHLYHKNGLRAWLGMVRRMALWQLIGQPAVIRSGTAVTFFAAPDEFIAMARAAGMHFVRHWQCDWPENRNNYLFQKPD